MQRTQVAIIGAGPAGLVLAHMLHLQGIDSVVVERHSRAHIEGRVRAGILEQPTVDRLSELGLADRLHREGMRHRGFYLRLDGTTHRLDFSSLIGGHATVYGQAELVKDLVAARLGTGRPLHFETEAVEVLEPASARPVVRLEGGSSGPSLLEADVVAACDGYRGVGRRSIPSAQLDAVTRTYPIAWLGILASSRPLAEEGMYCTGDRGLSLHSMRGPAITRQYLQVPPETDLADWPDERIWDELALRSASDDGETLERGEILERSLTSLRSYVVGRMAHGNLLLLGDAAHVLPPAGAKGLNLAVSDAGVASRAIAGLLTAGDRSALDSYTATALPRTLATLEFSTMLTATLHALGDDPLGERLRRSRMRRWIESEAARTALGEVYLGLPFPTGWTWT